MYSVVWTTVPSRAVGEKIALVLVREKLAACVNIVPGIRSVYAWKGKLEQTEEELMMIKTRQVLVDQVFKRIKELHPYEVPELISVPLDQVDKVYLNWIDEQTGDSIHEQQSE